MRLFFLALILYISTIFANSDANHFPAHRTDFSTDLFALSNTHGFLGHRGLIEHYGPLLSKRQQFTCPLPINCGTDYCCPMDTTCCGLSQKCCPTDANCRTEFGGSCCPKTAVTCGGKFCANEGTTCCGNSVCPPGTLCNMQGGASCCLPDEKMCNGGCCPSDSQCSTRPGYCTWVGSSTSTSTSTSTSINPALSASGIASSSPSISPASGSGSGSSSTSSGSTGRAVKTLNLESDVKYEGKWKVETEGCDPSQNPYRVDNDGTPSNWTATVKLSQEVQGFSISTSASTSAMYTISVNDVKDSFYGNQTQTGPNSAESGDTCTLTYTYDFTQTIGDVQNTMEISFQNHYMSGKRHVTSDEVEPWIQLNQIITYSAASSSTSGPNATSSSGTSDTMIPSATTATTSAANLLPKSMPHLCIVVAALAVAAVVVVRN